jgi:hypothetical protein
MVYNNLKIFGSLLTMSLQKVNVKEIRYSITNDKSYLPDQCRSKITGRVYRFSPINDIVSSFMRASNLQNCFFWCSRTVIIEEI